MRGFPMHHGNAKSIWIRSRLADYKQLISAPESTQRQRGNFATLSFGGPVFSSTGPPLDSMSQGSRKNILAKPGGAGAVPSAKKGFPEIGGATEIN